MDIAVALTNPGAETGDLTGWTTASGAVGVTTSGPHTGSYSFTSSVSSDFYQLIDVSAHATAIDAGTASCFATAWKLATSSSRNVTVHIYLECFASDGTTQLGTTAASDSTAPSNWANDFISTALPSGTRYVHLGGACQRGITGTARWDDFALTVADADTARVHQAVGYALASRPAEQARALQTPVLLTAAAETSNGNFLMKTHQVVAYALVKGKVDRVDLRAWCFLQDDHLFYGLQLGSAGTIVNDSLTGKWSIWTSPGKAYWRAEDVTDWQGYNLACDTEDGTIWKIDPAGRLDNGDTVITSQVIGQATVRGRRTIPCYTAEVACSQANPAASGTSIRLRTSDDDGSNWTDHGTIDGEAVGTATLFRYYGLGMMVAPGRQFEITNVGYARRIDGVDLEVGK